MKRENFKNLKNDYDILSVQRNLKILGIFVRLSKRDNKSTYLKYLPYTWSLINRRLKNPVFKNLLLLLKIDNIYSGYVHQIQRDRIFITDNDKIEIIIPKSEQKYNSNS